MKPSEVWLRYPSVHCTFPTFPGVDDVSSRGHTGMWLGILTSDMRMQPFYRYTPLIRISMKPSCRICTSFSHAGVIERTVATSEQT